MCVCSPIKTIRAGFAFCDCHYGDVRFRNCDADVFARAARFFSKTAGLLLLPGALLNGLMSPAMGALFDKFGPRKLIIPGTIVLVGVMFFFSRINPSVPIWAFIIVYIILMLSISAIMMPAQTNALNELPKHLYPHGTAISNTLQPVAGALGVSVFVSIMSQGQKSYLAGQEAASKQIVHEAMTHGVHHAYWFALALSCIAFFTALFIKKRSRLILIKNNQKLKGCPSSGHPFYHFSAGILPLLFSELTTFCDIMLESYSFYRKGTDSMESYVDQKDGIFKSVCSLDCPDQCGLLVHKKTEKSLKYRATRTIRSHRAIFAIKSAI